MATFKGQLLHAELYPARIGDVYEIPGEGGRLRAEVVGFSEHTAYLAPYLPPRRWSSDLRLEPTGKGLQVPCHPELRGVVLNGRGEPSYDPKQQLQSLETELLEVEPDRQAYYAYEPVSSVLETGVRAIDSCLTLGVGQRIALFAPQGTGQRSLYAQLARNSDIDVAVVHLPVSRRLELYQWDQLLGERGRARTVTVYCAADNTPITRLRSADVALRMAEYYRDQGLRVLLMISDWRAITQAHVEITAMMGGAAWASGSAQQMLGTHLERAAHTTQSTITCLHGLGITEGCEDDPLAAFLRGSLDGHIYLSRELGQRGHWPAIDVAASLSRSMPDLVSPQHLEQAAALRERLDSGEESLAAFFQQQSDEHSSLEQTLEAMQILAP